MSDSEKALQLRKTTVLNINARKSQEKNAVVENEKKKLYQREYRARKKAEGTTAIRVRTDKDREADARYALLRHEKKKEVGRVSAAKARTTKAAEAVAAVVKFNHIKDCVDEWTKNQGSIEEFPNVLFRELKKCKTFQERRDWIKQLEVWTNDGKKWVDKLQVVADGRLPRKTSETKALLQEITYVKEIILRFVAASEARLEDARFSLKPKNKQRK